MLDKDTVHLEMRRCIHKSRIVFLDFPLNHEKGEGQTTFMISMETDFARINEIGEGQRKVVMGVAECLHVEQTVRSTSPPRRTSLRSSASQTTTGSCVR